MRFRIRRCPHCNTYTLKEKCKRCGKGTVSAHPAKFSPEDKYALYRVRWDETTDRTD